MLFKSESIHWNKPIQIENKSYKCGFCENIVSSFLGLRSGILQDGSGSLTASVHLCPNCRGATFFTIDGLQMPGFSYGNTVKNLPDSVNSVYEEARSCFKNNNFTASVLLCRKLLMNIAVSQGAKEGLSFFDYIEYLSEKGFIPPNGKGWVNHIRQKGNEATHEIKVMNEEDGKELIDFSEMLLKFIYEFPNRLPPK